MGYSLEVERARKNGIGSFEIKRIKTETRAVLTRAEKEIARLDAELRAAEERLSDLESRRKLRQTHCTKG